MGIKELIFDRKRSEEEHKIVIETLQKINHYTYNQSYAVFSWLSRSKNYEELQKLPGIIYELQRENYDLKQEVSTYKKRVESVDSVINTLIDDIEMRYEMKKTKKDD